MDSSKTGQGKQAADGQATATASAKGASDPRPQPKQGRAVDSAPVTAGSGDAAAKGGQVKPVKSTLLGENGDRPAAQPKASGAQDAKAAKPASPEQADVKSAGTSVGTSGAKPATPAMPADKPADKTVPSSVPPTTSKASADAGPAAKPAPVVVRKTGFLPTVLGGVVAAGLGAAAMYYVMPQLPEGWRTAPAAAPDMQALTDQALAAARDAGRDAGAQAGADAGADAARQALDAAAPKAGSETDAAAEPAALPQGLSDQLDQQAAQIAALDQAVAALSASVPAANAGGKDDKGGAGDPSTAGQATGVAAIGPAELAGLKETVSTLQDRVAELSQRPALDPEAAKKLQSLAQDAEAMQDRMTKAAEDVRQQIDAARAQADKLESDVIAASKSALGQAAVARLHGALSEGGDTAAALADLNAAGVETPAALAQDVPSLVSLQQGFDEAARAGLRAALQDKSQRDGAMGVIGNFLKAQTGARSVTPRAGSDADAVLSRAGAAVKAGDIAAALAEIDSLPDSARQAMDGWIGQARRHAAAQAALNDLSSDAK
ncbi:mitofilin family membrane protein [Paracoccus jiaweipingae]|uniref:mitofilin family membrane protein n=1 Tax=unclassified Paracoccus (in: a-proteobacteria) TaxID=2688777 RepID=UPI0037AC0FE7